MKFLRTQLNSNTLLTMAISTVTSMIAKVQAVVAEPHTFLEHITRFAADYSILIGVAIGVLKLLVEFKNFIDAYFGKKKSRE